MVLCDELMCVMNSLSFSSPWVQTIKMSSMYLHQMNGLSGDWASSFLSKHEREALQKLITRTDIVIKPADKGKAVVVLDTKDYKK